MCTQRRAGKALLWSRTALQAMSLLPSKSSSSVSFVGMDMSNKHGGVAAIPINRQLLTRTTTPACQGWTSSIVENMFLFCPSCSSLLLLDSGQGECTLACPACPYRAPLPPGTAITSRLPLPRKQVDDVLGGDEAWKNVDQTDASCPKCEGQRAYFMQIQIRSADEPSSIFYKCTRLECGHQWREG